MSKLVEILVEAVADHFLRGPWGTIRISDLMKNETRTACWL